MLFDGVYGSFAGELEGNLLIYDAIGGHTTPLADLRSDGVTPGARRLKRGASLQPAPNPRKGGWGKLAPYHDFLNELLKQDPDITLAELRGALENAPGVRASISGVDPALKAAWLHV